MSTDLKATLIYVSPLIALAAVLVLGSHVLPFGTLVLYLTLLAGGVVLVLFLRQRPWRPAVFLLAVTPFQGVIIRNYGMAGSVLTVLAVAAFLLSVSPRSWPHRLLGTGTQRLVALVMVGFAISVAAAGFESQALLVYSQRVMLFFVVAVLVYGSGWGAHLHKLAWAAAGSTALLFILSILDFYFGLRVLPVAGSRSFEAGLLEEMRRGLDVGFNAYRLAGPAQTYGANKFAFYAVLPISLLVGLLLTERKGWRAGLGGACLLILGFGVLASGSLSGMTGTGAALALALLASTRRPVRGLLLVAVVAVALVQFTRVIPERVISGRFANLSPAVESRLAPWSFGFDLFRESPIYGTGLTRFGDEVASRGLLSGQASPPYSAPEPHGVFNQLLSETGIVGTVPFVLLLMYVLWVLVRGRSHADRNVRLWSWIMVASLVGMLLSSTFGTYQYDRFFWVPISFAAVLERMRPGTSATKTATAIPDAGSRVPVHGSR